MILPGSVYYLPPNPEEGPAKGHRPHLSLCAENRALESVTLAFCSTRSTEAIHGAAHVFFGPSGPAFRRSGLRAPTYVYLSRLVHHHVPLLPLPAGTLGEEMPGIRQRLRLALGIGTGVTDEGVYRGRNRRGRLVRYGPEVQAGFAEYGLVVTEPEYSRRGRFQTTIPLFSPAQFRMAEGDVAVRSRRRWDGPGRTSQRRAPATWIAVVPLIVSIYEPEHAAGYTSWRIDASSMREIDQALIRYFGL